MVTRYNHFMSIVDSDQQNQLLTDEIRRRIDQLSAVATVAASIGQSLDLDRTLQTALTAVLSVTGARAGGISLIDLENNEVVLRAQEGWLRDFVHENPMRIPVGRGLSGRVIVNDTVIVNNNLNETEQLAVPSFHEEQFRSIAMAPMHAQGQVVGILSIMSLKPDAFDEGHIAVLTSVADTVGVALAQASLYERSQEDQRRLTAVLQSSADGIIATDQSGLVQIVNTTAENLLGVRAENMVGLSLRQVPIPIAIREALVFALEAPAQTETRSFRASTPEGRMLSVLMNRVHVPSQLREKSAAGGWVIVLQDVTLMAEMEVARAQFIKSAAHDMRNPLTAAVNSLAMMKRVIALPSETTLELIDIAQTSVARLQSLIDDLVSIELLQSSYELNMSAVDVGEMLYEVSSGVLYQLDELGLTLHHQLSAALPPLMMDRRWVMRAVQNYLDNAMRYAPSGSQIILRAFPRESHLHIEVSDNGQGVAPADRARLFERFFRADDALSQGAGLGLAMVKSIAEAHGGHVYFESHDGQGSTFGLTLMMRLPDVVPGSAPAHKA
jgi:PAS domain S-box-containing protein